MPPNSEIEKLERRWRENPKGTVFAPYAEVLRKNGDHELAKEVLRQGLELHPDHIPGNIVLGRCCLDLGEDGPAENAFGHVLELDAENVIALKALADITERHGRLAEANSWLQRLISVDPSNDEARDQLARVDAAQQTAASLTTGSLPVQTEEEVTVEVIPPALPSTVKTREIPAFRRPSEAGAAPAAIDRTEAGGGVVREEGTPITRAVLAAFHARNPAPPEAAPPEGRVLENDEARAADVLPLLPAEPEPITDLEPMELDIAAAAKDLGEVTLPGIEVEEEFVPQSLSADPPPAPAAPEPPPIPDAGHFGYRPEERTPIELRPSLASEFQAPDASNELLDLTPTERSEFQAPDASNELLDLTPTGRSEFQAPDASNELLDITPTERSEFQAPDASNELLDLRPSGRSEFQTPDATNDLLDLTPASHSEFQIPNASEQFSASLPAETHDRVEADEPVAEPTEPEPEPVDLSSTAPSLLDDLAALTTAPTEEIATTMMPAISAFDSTETSAPPETPADLDADPEPAAAPDWLFEEESSVEVESVDLVETTGSVADDTAPEEDPATVAELSERIAAAYAEAEAEARAAASAEEDIAEEEPESLATDDVAELSVADGVTLVDSGSIDEPARPSDLKLIFPDDAAQPEPHQVRRLTQEVELPAMAEEIDDGEPEPVLTETMAELYARQGHTGEALKVYRALVERQPNDARLRERIAELETRSPQPQRRLTYVALETGGESVESFFRSLGESRPGGSVRHGSGQILDDDDDGSGAPTRPARDPLSLSAIFGEDPGPPRPGRRRSRQRRGRALPRTMRSRLISSSVAPGMAVGPVVRGPKGPPGRTSTSSSTGSRVSRSNAPRRPQRSESQFARYPRT